MVAPAPVPPEQHLANRRAFLQQDKDESGFCLYCKMVALELALKDRDPQNFSFGHDVFEMLRQVFPATVPAHASVNTAAGAAEGFLARLTCTGRKGRPAQVVSSKYPDLRYLRRTTDFSTGACTEDDVTKSLDCLQTLLQEATRLGLEL